MFWGDLHMSAPTQRRRSERVRAQNWRWAVLRIVADNFYERALIAEPLGLDVLDAHIRFF